jgi:hypothetical protein
MTDAELLFTHPLNTELLVTVHVPAGCNRINAYVGVFVAAGVDNKNIWEGAAAEFQEDKDVLYHLHRRSRPRKDNSRRDARKRRKIPTASVVSVQPTPAPVLPGTFARSSSVVAARAARDADRIGFQMGTAVMARLVEVAAAHSTKSKGEIRQDLSLFNSIRRDMEAEIGLRIRAPRFTEVEQVLQFFDGTRGCALDYSPDIVSLSSCTGIKVRIGNTDPAAMHLPATRLTIQSATHDEVKSLEEFEALVHQTLVGCMPTASDMQDHRVTAQFAATSSEPSIVYSALLGFQSEQKRNEAAKLLRVVFPGRHVFARNSKTVVSFISLDIVTRVVPLLLLSARDVVLPVPEDGKITTVDAWLCYWFDCAQNKSEFRCFLLSPVLYPGKGRSAWELAAAARGHESTLFNHTEFQTTLDQLAAIGHEGVTYRCRAGEQTYHTRVRVLGLVADQLAMSTYFKWPGSSSPHRMGWTMGLSDYFGIVFHQGKTDPKFEAVEHKRTAYKNLLGRYKEEIDVSLATGKRQPVKNSQVERAIRLAAYATKKMILDNPNYRTQLADCCMLSPQLHIVSYVIRTALELHCKYLLPEKCTTRAKIESILRETAACSANGKATASNTTYRRMIATWAATLCKEAQLSDDPSKRACGLLVLLTARFVQAVYRDTATSCTLELRLMAHTMTLMCTYFSARVGGTKPEAFGSAKMKDANVGGFKSHTNNLYYAAAVTLLTATQDLLHAIGVSLLSANEEHGEAAIQAHTRWAKVLRDSCDPLAEQRLDNQMRERGARVPKRTKRGAHDTLRDAVPVRDVLFGTCMSTGDCPLQVINPKTGDCERELDFFVVNQRVFLRLQPASNNKKTFLTRSGCVLFGAAREPSKLRAAMSASPPGYVDTHDPLKHEDLLFVCVCGGCSLKPKAGITRDFNMHDLRAGLWRVGGERLRREDADIAGARAANIAAAKVASIQRQEGKFVYVFPLFKFLAQRRVEYMRAEFGPHSEASATYISSVVDHKLQLIDQTMLGRKIWSAKFKLYVQIESLRSMVTQRAKEGVTVHAEIPLIPAVWEMDAADGGGRKPPKRTVDPGYCRCTTRKCTTCVCAKKLRPCNPSCHGKEVDEDSDNECGNAN